MFAIEKDLEQLTPEERKIEDLLPGFQDFQKSVKYLADTSVNSESNQMRRFLNFIYQQSPENFDVSNICAMDIRNYFAGEVAHLKPSTKGRIATSIRNFFQYLRFSRVNVDESIFKIPLTPAVWKLNSIPTVLSDLVMPLDSKLADGTWQEGLKQSIYLQYMRLASIPKHKFPRRESSGNVMDVWHLIFTQKKKSFG